MIFVFANTISMKRKILVYNTVLLLLIALIIGVMLLSSNSITASAGESGASKIKVSGSASILCEPDEVKINLGVNTFHASPSKACEENADIMEKAYTVLSAMGIPMENVSTVSYNIYPNYYYTDASRQINGYTVQNEIRLILNDIKGIGELIDSLTKAGVNSINSLQYSVKDYSLFYREALKEALSDADKKASVIAMQVGASYRLINFTEEANYYGYDGGNYIKMDSVAATQLASGQVNITANVSVEYELYL